MKKRQLNLYAVIDLMMDGGFHPKYRYKILLFFFVTKLILALTNIFDVQQIKSNFFSAD